MNDKQKIRREFGYQLYACGQQGMPKQIEFKNHQYQLTRVFKHDFFAATGLYEFYRPTRISEQTPPSRIVLKLSRQKHFLGLPLLWLGKLISKHEFSNLCHLADLQGTPQVLSRYGKTGLIYEYIEGKPLSLVEKVPENFFDNLAELIDQVHQKNIVYVDMNKRNNILCGPNGRPSLVDFQISLHIDESKSPCRPILKYVKEKLIKADIYHIFKHKRRICPELLTPKEKDISRCSSRWIKFHRLIATPFRKLRRALLNFLRAKGFLALEDTPEKN